MSYQLLDAKNCIQKDIAISHASLALLTTEKANELAFQAERNSCQTNAYIAEGFCKTNANIADSEYNIIAACNANENARLKDALAYANTVNLINRRNQGTSGNFC